MWSWNIVKSKYYDLQLVPKKVHISDQNIEEYHKVNVSSAYSKICNEVTEIKHSSTIWKLPAEREHCGSLTDAGMSLRQFPQGSASCFLIHRMHGQAGEDAANTEENSMGL